ncbi:MAG: HAD family phosphatase [Candidatus Neomarinimicrobiota bacterium]
MAIKAIIFDFDGVVIDSEPIYVTAERRIFDLCGINVPDEDWKYFKGTTEEEFFQLSMAKYNIQTDPEKLIKIGRRYIKEEFRKGIDYYPGFMDFWQSIAGRYRTALVTSTSAKFLRWLFRHTAIKNCFDLTITADDVQQAKPHPEPYLTAMNQLRVSPAESLIIEDSLNGTQAAVASGAVVIGFLSSLSNIDLPQVHFHARSYDEIGEILTRLG